MITICCKNIFQTGPIWTSELYKLRSIFRPIHTGKKLFFGHHGKNYYKNSQKKLTQNIFHYHKNDLFTNTFQIHWFLIKKYHNEINDVFTNTSLNHCFSNTSSAVSIFRKYIESISLFNVQCLKSFEVDLSVMQS